MKREEMIQKLAEPGKVWDVIVIGGGATGLGCALEAATRGYSTLLLEMHDFTKSTSSKSTKLLHGGVRYMAQGDIALVREACHERGRLLKNAPHLAKNQSFVIANYSHFDTFLYTCGLTFYDMLAGTLSLGRSYFVSPKKALKMLSTIRKSGLKSGVVYHDGQFDDSRLAVNVAQTSAEAGAALITYMPVKSLLKENGKVAGVTAEDLESGITYTIPAKAVINATGVFVDDILRMNDPEVHRSVRPSQGVHLVVDKKFLPEGNALMVPKTDDGRVLFAVPWHDKVVVGTTDTPLDASDTSLEPKALDQEIEFILRTAQNYMDVAPQRSDVLSVFAGLRPLAAPTGDGTKTKEISRSHKILVTDSDLVTITGGKWTSFRRMAEDTVTKLESVKNWNKTKSITKDFPIHGHRTNPDFNNPMYFYGSDEDEILKIIKQDAALGVFMSQALRVNKAQVIWAVRNEMARTVEDFLARRTRCILLDAKESIKIAPVVAEVMATELGKDGAWVEAQIKAYTEVAEGYILK